MCFADLLIILLLKEPRADQQCDNDDMGPLMLNAFDLIILSQGLNLATIFDRGQVFNCYVVFAMRLSNHISKWSNNMNNPCTIQKELYRTIDVIFSMLQGSCDVKYIIATPILSFKGLKLINIFHISGYDI